VQPAIADRGLATHYGHGDATLPGPRKKTAAEAALEINLLHPTGLARLPHATAFHFFR
jgi:hypothetical protein